MRDFFLQLDEGGIKGGNLFSPLSLPTQYLQRGMRLGVGILCKRGKKTCKKSWRSQSNSLLGGKGEEEGVWAGDEKPQQPASQQLWFKDRSLPRRLVDVNIYPKSRFSDFARAEGEKKKKKSCCNVEVRGGGWWLLLRNLRRKTLSSLCSLTAWRDYV